MIENSPIPAAATAKASAGESARAAGDDRPKIAFGRFKPVADGKAVFYTSSVSGDGTQLGEVLAFIEEEGGTTLLTAKSGTQAPSEPSRAQLPPPSASTARLSPSAVTRSSSITAFGCGPNTL